MLAAFQGYLLSRQEGVPYCYNPLTTIRLLNLGNTNDELYAANSIISTIMGNLGVPECASVDGPTFNIPVPYGEVTDRAFSKESLKCLSEAWPLNPPEYFKDNFNIAVHIRRGADVNPEISDRWGDSGYYNLLIEDLLVAYPTAVIHTFSWNDPQLASFPKDRVVKHISSNGGEFLEHYNALVCSDILMVASSSFSNSAALFNKNTVMVDPDIMFLADNPYCNSWVENYNNFRKII